MPWCKTFIVAFLGPQTIHQSSYEVISNESFLLLHSLFTCVDFEKLFECEIRFLISLASEPSKYIVYARGCNSFGRNPLTDQFEDISPSGSISCAPRDATTEMFYKFMASLRESVSTSSYYNILRSGISRTIHLLVVTRKTRDFHSVCKPHTLVSLDRQCTSLFICIFHSNTRLKCCTIAFYAHLHLLTTIVVGSNCLSLLSTGPTTCIVL